MCYQLKAHGESVSDSMMITKILMTIPPKYNHFLSAWDSTDAAHKTLENLASRLMMEERRVEAQDNAQDSAVVASSAAKGRRNFRGRGGRGRQNYAPRNENTRDRKDARNIVCFICNKKGHIKVDCWFNPENPNNKLGDREKSTEENGLIAIDVDEALINAERREDARDESWILDSGASKHISSEKQRFSNLVKIKPRPVKLGDGRIVYAVESGRINVQAHNGKNWEQTYPADVLYVPQVTFNLFSLGAVWDKGVKVNSSQNRINFYKNNKIVTVAEKPYGINLFIMKFKIEKKVTEALVAVNNTSSKISDLKLWLERFAHQNFDHVRKFLKNNNIKINYERPLCDACVLGKMHRAPFPISTTVTKAVGELIHTDLCGPIEELSISKKKYFLIFKDDFSGYVKVYFLESKGQVKGCFLNFVQRIEKETGNKINTLRSDNGLEYINQEIAKITFENGIKHERTVIYTPEQNGKAERGNRTIAEAVRTTLIAKNLPKKL